MALMKSQNKNCITILGTGTSTGIPLLGCTCTVCTSIDHRDQRLRTSIFVTTKKGKQFLVDTTPDLRTQFLNNKISTVDFVIITHEHADHLHGLDDLSPLCFGPPLKEIPLYTTAESKAVIENRFPYIFNNQRPIIGGGIPRLKIHPLKMMEETIIDGETFTFFIYPHGHGETMGFLHEGFAYIVDCASLPNELIEFLSEKKLDLLIIDCLQRKAHGTHLSVEKSFEYIKKINPRNTGLIHMGHDLSHIALEKLALNELGPSVIPLFDQQKLFY